MVDYHFESIGTSLLSLLQKIHPSPPSPRCPGLKVWISDILKERVEFGSVPATQKVQALLQCPLMVVPRWVGLRVSLDAVHAKGQLFLIDSSQRLVAAFTAVASIFSYSPDLLSFKSARSRHVM